LKAVNSSLKQAATSAHVHGLIYLKIGRVEFASWTKLHSRPHAPFLKTRLFAAPPVRPRSAPSDVLLPRPVLARFSLPSLPVRPSGDCRTRDPRPCGRRGLAGARRRIVQSEISPPLSASRGGTGRPVEALMARVFVGSYERRICRTRRGRSDPTRTRFPAYSGAIDDAVQHCHSVQLSCLLPTCYQLAGHGSFRDRRASGKREPHVRGGRNGSGPGGGKKPWGPFSRVGSIIANVH
jgi:hypothetical protein